VSACENVRRLILEAEPDELRGIGPGAVATHVRGCTSCARLAGRILDETAALDEYLAAEADASAVERVLRRAGIPIARTAPTPARPRRAWVRPSAWVALAAAASVTVLLVARGRIPTPTSRPVALAVAAPPPLVQSSSDRTVAVMQTDNPDITVLWFFQGGVER
jgi:hypothetical protein